MISALGSITGMIGMIGMIGMFGMTAMAAPAPTYEAVMAEAASLTAAGRPLAAARRLEALRSEHPQDFAAASAAGWAWHAGMAWERAEAAFEDADALSGGGASEGLAAVAAARAPRVSARPTGAASFFTDHPEWTHGYAGGASLDATLEGRALIGGQARAGALEGTGGRAPWLEGHAGVGATWLRWGVMAHAAALGGLTVSESPGDASGDAPGAAGARTSGNGGNGSAGSDGGNGNGNGNGNAQRGPPEPVDSALAGGGSARWSPWGDVYLEGGAVRWKEGAAWRGVAAWTSPAAGPLTLRPGGALQAGVDGAGWSTFGAARLSGEAGALEIGGRYGDEERPVALGARSIHPLPGRVLGGGWAWARLEATEALGIELGWEWLRSSVDGERTDLHVAAVSATWSAGGAS